MRHLNNRLLKEYKRDEHGFTIVELLIATAIFATILLVLTFAVIGVTENYYKGIAQSQTQNTARSAMDSLIQFVQFDTTTGQVPTINNQSGSSYYWFCSGNQIFVFEPFWQLKTNPNATLHQASHAFVEGTVTACPSSSTALTLSSGGIAGLTPAPANQTELLGLNMRLSQLTFSQINGTAVKISLQVTYGDDDLLVPAWNATNPTCTGKVGFEYCAFSPLTTVVQPRQSS